MGFIFGGFGVLGLTPDDRGVSHGSPALLGGGRVKYPEPPHGSEGSVP
jgi:hypothetical protein